VTATAVLLIVAGVVAIGDWIAVHLRLFHLEYLLKPATLAVLVAAAVVADLGDIKPWVVAALVLGLLGDVGLMLSDGGTDPPFLAGLGAFLLGHVCYVIAFVSAGLQGLATLAGLLVTGGIAGLALPAVLRGAARSAGTVFAGIVGGYAATLAAMTVLGVGTGIVATAIGAVSFLCSDTLIARDRFVGRVPHGKLLIIVTYHVAQALILIGLGYGR
jgi:uncharacterized membrane protein YhhN